MTWWTSLLLGLIQGISEFLPISSSGHLSVFQKLMGVDLESRLLFDVLLHAGTLFAVCVAYRKDIMELIRGFIAFCRGKPAGDGETISAQRLLLMLIIATVPLVLVIFLRDVVEALTGNMYFIGGALLATSLLLFISERLPVGRKGERNATVSDALIVGISQVIAIVPGLSRSGTTITAGLFRGFERSFAVRFSFLMSLPAVIGATLLEVISLFKDGADATELLIYIPGVIAAAAAGYLSIQLLRRIAEKGNFRVFMVYTLLAGFAVIVWTLLS